MTEQELKQSIINLLSKKINLFASTCTQNNNTLTNSAFKSKQSEIIAALNSTQSQPISYYSNYANYINSYLTCLLLTYPNSVNNVEFKATTDTLNNLFQLLLDYIKAIKAKSNNTKTEVKPTAIIKNTVSKVPTLPTVTKSTTPRSEIALTPEQWGIKFTTTRKASSEDIRFLATADKGTVNDNFYMDLLPARQSTIPVQGGRDVPNAMPGLNYKLIPQVGKQQIPGFSPVYQNLGIKGMQVTIVGAFTGGDGSVSNRKTDTPEPNSKTPFWSNAKGGPTLSDNPGRGGKLPELTAYNSSAEFKQVVYQGKQIEVEINLFQVYNQSTASQIGQDIKLQSKNGNPKFTGIVRSLVEDHATKERTWYTLVMDVTDFGMASKEPINLNNKLEEAIRNAQAELEAAQKLEAEKAANPTSEIADAALDQINKSNLSAEDKVKYKKKLAWFVFLSKEALSNNYVDGSRLEPLMSELQSGKKDNISYIQAIALSNDRVLIKIANKCTFTEEYRKILFLQQNLTLAKLTSSIMSEFTKFSIEKNNRDIFKCENISYFLFGKDVILKEYLMSPNDPTPFKNDSRLTSTSLPDLNSLISQRLNSLSGPEIIAIFGKATGCVTAAGLGGAILGGLVGIGTAAVVCISQAGDNVYKAYLNNDPNTQDYNYVKGELFSGDSIREWITTFATTLTIDAVTVGLGSKLTGGGIRQGISQAYKQGAVYKGGNLLKGKPSSISTNNTSTVSGSFIENLNKIPNIESKLLGQTITFKGQSGVIESLAKNADGTLTGNVTIKYSNGQIAFVNLNFADSLPNVNLPTQPTVTTSTSANSSTVTSSGAANISRLINEIDDLSISDEIKRYIKSLDPENQRKVLTVINTQKANSTKSFTISRQGQSDLLVNPGDAFSISSSGFLVRKGSVVYDIPYIEVTGSRVLKTSSISNRTNQTTPPIVTLSALDNTINGLPNLSTAAKAALINLPNPDKVKALDILQSNVADLQFTINGVSVGKGTTKPILTVTINNQGKLLYKVQGSVSFNQNQIDLNNVTVSKPATVTTPLPSQSPIPQQQTTTKTPQTQQPGATYYPDGELNEVNIMSGGFPEGLPTKGFKMFNILKNLGYEKQFSLFKRPSIKFKNPNTNEIKTVKALSFLQGTDNGDSIFIITGNKQRVFVNLIDIISINGIE